MTKEALRETYGGRISSLTWGVVGHVAPHGVRPSLVHHPLHAVKGRRVWGASSHHALWHALWIAWWPGRRKDLPITQLF